MEEVFGDLMVKYTCPKTDKEVIVEPESKVMSVDEYEQAIVGYFICPSCGNEHSYLII